MKQDTEIVLIREMRGEDIEPLAEALGFPWEWINQRWEETVARWRDAFVAEVDGSPVGSVSINERPERPGMLHLFALDVAEDRRNQGVGSSLVAFVETEAMRRGLCGVYLEVAIENVGARRLYERLGYAKDGRPFTNSRMRRRADREVEEVVEDMQRMVKRLG